MRIAASDITITYNAREPIEKVAVRNANIVLTSGLPSTLLGANGSGKSTLLQALAGLVRPDNGVIVVSPDSGSEHVATSTWLRRHVEYLQQDPIRGLFPELTLCENLALRVQRTHRGVLDPYVRSKRFSAMEDHLGKLVWFYKDRRHRRLLSLSGGERQVFAVGVARIAERSVVLLDEPTAALDPDASRTVERMLSEWLQDSSVAALIVTHDESLASRLGFRLLHMRDGGLVDAATM